MYNPAIGDHDHRNKIEIEGRLFQLELYDIGSTEQFAAMSDLYMQTGNVFILCYSVTTALTLLYLKDIIDHLQLVRDATIIPMVLCACKCDLISERKITTAAGIEFAKSYYMPYIETSSKTNHNVEELIIQAARTAFNFVTMHPGSLVIPHNKCSIS